MTQRKKLKNERDLEEARQQKNFERQESLHDAIHAIHLKIVKWALPTFIALFLMSLFQPPFIKNMILVHDALVATGSSLFTALLARTTKQTF